MDEIYGCSRNATNDSYRIVKIWQKLQWVKSLEHAEAVMDVTNTLMAVELDLYNIKLTRERKLTVDDINVYYRYRPV